MICFVFFYFAFCRICWIHLNQKRKRLHLPKNAMLMMCQILNLELIFPENSRNQKGNQGCFLYWNQKCVLPWILSRLLSLHFFSRWISIFVTESICNLLPKIRRLLPASSILVRDFSAVGAEDDVEKPKVNLTILLFSYWFAIPVWFIRL